MRAEICRLCATVAAVLTTAWLAMSVSAQVVIQGDALAGEPFGVGRLTIEMAGPSQPDVLGLAGLGLAEKDGRVLYPVLDQRPFRAMLRDLLGASSGRATVYFLFRGKPPLQMKVQGQTLHEFKLDPRNDPRAHRRLLEAWWLAYAPPPRLLGGKADDPPMLENYLQSMLARRLGFVVPERDGKKSWQDQLGEDLGVFLGTESIRMALQQDRMLGRLALREPADQPLPEPIRPPALLLPALPEKIEIEPIAMRVPEECLYLRFASITNFLWFREQLERWSSDLGNLVSSRGLDYELIKRAEDQLCLRQSAMSKALGAAVSGLIGGTAVADVAVIGTDAFQREGAAIGVLLQARGNDLLAREILRQRSEAVKAGKGVKEETVEIGGRKVSFLSAPNNAVRSFYVADGPYHFVTTSKALVERFLQTRDGAGSLGAAMDFRHARAIVPVRRDDTAFIYLSDAFFRNVTGPKYRVEMTRRLQAQVDVGLVQMAVLAAAAEGRPGGSIEALKSGGFLPADFGPRPDGSRAVLAGGEAVDSLRGRRGRFLPIPDVEITRVTESEAGAYERFAEHYRSQWGRVDPMIVALKRVPLADNREKVVIDVRVSPLNRQSYETLTQWLGPADKNGLAPIPGDVFFGEAILRDQRVFAGIRDVNLPKFQIGGGAISIAAEWPLGGLGIKPLLVGYVGSHGDPGLLGLLDALVPGPPDAAGYAGVQGGLWRRQFDRFTVYSLQSELLADVTPKLKFQEEEHPAQVRLRIADVSQAKLAPLVNAWGYAKTRETCMGNLRLLHAMEQQLHVPGADCRDAAELLLDARLICPLRGKYVYQESSAGAKPRTKFEADLDIPFRSNSFEVPPVVKRWTSTALDAGGGGLLAAARVPEGFQAPPLNWFRGLSLVAGFEPGRVSARAEVLMQAPPQK
jgi:hypothetical protein